MKGFPNGQCSHSSHYRGASHGGLCQAIQTMQYKNRKNNRPKMEKCRQKWGKNRPVRGLLEPTCKKITDTPVFTFCLAGLVPTLN